MSAWTSTRSAVKALGAVARDSVAVVEMTVLGRVELDSAIVVEAGGDATF